MTGIEYLVLLRGINVGGKNLIKMAELKACLETAGFENVATYIQSGNVLLKSNRSDSAKLTKEIEALLSKEFGYQARLVLCSHTELKQIVAKAPPGFGSKPDMYHSDIIFLKQPLTAAEAMKSIQLREGVDMAVIGPKAIYFSRLTSRRTQSRMSRMVGTPAYQNMTIRTWNTVTKLLALMDAS